MTEMEITHISPNITVKGEEKTLSIIGSGFVKTPGLKCYYGNLKNPLKTELVSDREIKCELPKRLTRKTGESEVFLSFDLLKKKERLLSVKHNIGLPLPKVGYHFLSHVAYVFSC